MTPGIAGDPITAILPGALTIQGLIPGPLPFMQRAQFVYSVFWAFLLAYFMKKYGFPVVPMLLAIILGPQLEEHLRMSLIIAEGNPAIFFTHPISLIFIIIAVISFVSPLIRRSKKTGPANVCEMDNAN